MTKTVCAIVLILVGCAVGQATKNWPTKTPKPSTEASTAQSHAGRYQIFFSPHARADMYLVDTETGKIWKPVTITNARDTNMDTAAPQVWVYQDRIDNEQEFDVWIASHKPLPTSTATPQK